MAHHTMAAQPSWPAAVRKAQSTVHIRLLKDGLRESRRIPQAGLGYFTVLKLNVANRVALMKMTTFHSPGGSDSVKQCSEMPLPV